jgi:hypothetical protein
MENRNHLKDTPAEPDESDGTGLKYKHPAQVRSGDVRAGAFAFGTKGWQNRRDWADATLVGGYVPCLLDVPGEIRSFIAAETRSTDAERVFVEQQLRDMLRRGVIRQLNVDNADQMPSIIRKIFTVTQGDKIRLILDARRLALTPV